MSWKLNSLAITDQTMLLTKTTSGIAVHLTTEDATADARAAMPDWVGRSREVVADELLDKLWSPVALCGRTWSAMAGGFDDHTGRPVDRPEAPTCRNCLAVIDKAFPTPELDDRVGVLAGLAATAVNEHGTAEIVGVPGDQMNALRRAVRAELRRRFGFSTRTYAQDGLLVVSSPETHHLIEQTALRAMAELDLEEAAAIDDSDWRFDWTSWSVS